MKPLYKSWDAALYPDDSRNVGPTSFELDPGMMVTKVYCQVTDAYKSVWLQHTRNDYWFQFINGEIVWIPATPAKAGHWRIQALFKNESADRIRLVRIFAGGINDPKPPK
jgi:hypothetical protein